MPTQHNIFRPVTRKTLIFLVGLTYLNVSTMCFESMPLIFLSYDIVPLLFDRMNADVFSHGRIQRGGGGTGPTSDFLRNSGTDHP